MIRGGRTDFQNARRSHQSSAATWPCPRTTSRVDALRGITVSKNGLEFRRRGMLPRYAISSAIYESGIGDHLRPPLNQALRLQPETVFRPLSIKNKNGVPGSPYGFAFGPMLLLEPVNGKNIPGTVLRKVANPG